MMSAHCLIFPFGGYDLHTTLALGLGFLCHGALHVVGEGNVFDLDCRYLRAPRLGVAVDHILDLLADARSIRKKLIKAKSSNNIAHRCLADLIDRVVDVLNDDLWPLLYKPAASVGAVQRHAWNRG